MRRPCRASSDHGIMSLLGQSPLSHRLLLDRSWERDRPNGFGVPDTTVDSNQGGHWNKLRHHRQGGTYVIHPGSVGTYTVTVGNQRLQKAVKSGIMSCAGSRGGHMLLRLENFPDVEVASCHSGLTNGVFLSGQVV